jgi:alpha-L-fucosidase 2
MKKTETFELDFPIPRTLCGIVMGNGNFGAMVWGEENLHITVNRADFWDHRGGETLLEGTTYAKLAEASFSNDNKKLNDAFIRKECQEDVFKPQRIPVGRFEFKLKEGEMLENAVLEYETGELVISVKSGMTLKLNLGVKENILLVEDNANIIEETILKPSWEFEQSREWLSKYAFKAPETMESNNIKGWAQSCPDDPSLASVCKKVNGTYLIALELGDSNQEAFDNALDKLKDIGEASLIKENRQWWSKYWQDIPEINLPEDFFNKFYKYALYKFAGATSPESSIPAGLQGPWIEEYHQAQWSGDYHFNVNIQQIYTLALATGRLENLLPLFDMLESDVFLGNMRHNAKVMFGIDDGLLLTHAVDDRGFQCGGISAGSTLDQACGAWTAQLYWLYYQYSLDEDFLKKRAYPFMYGVLRVYEEMLEERDGKLSLPIAISAEYGCRNPNGLKAGRDPSYQLAGIHMLLDALLESSEILGLEPRPAWRRMKEKVPYFTVIEGDDPYMKKEKRIAVWEGQDLEVCHRHHSHLGSIYPFDTLPEEQNNEMKEIVDNSIDQWILMGMGQWSEWCMPWAAILQTRLGFNEAPSVLLNMWKEIFVNEGMTTVYLPRFRGIIAHRRHDMCKPKESNEVMQLDGTMGCATALLEMLAHTHSGVTKVFAGIPDKWKNVSFMNIRLPGAFLISASKENGKFKEAEVESIEGGTIKIDIFGVKTTMLCQHGEHKQIQLPCSITLSKDEKIRLSP